MKRMRFIVCFVVAVVFLGCAKTKVCHYGTTYSEDTKDCEC